MDRKIIYLAVFFSCVFSAEKIQGQNADLKSTVKQGLTGLTLWGGVSTVGGLAYGLTSDKTFDKNYGITHAAWGGVNAIIGGIALATVNKSFDKKGYQSTPEIQHQFAKQFRQVYFINSVFDLGYIGMGYGIWRTGFNQQKFTPDQQALRKAVGNASMIQGAGLLVYDLLMWNAVKKYKQPNENKVGFHWKATPTWVQVQYKW